MLGDVHHQPQIRPHHPLPRFRIVLIDDEPPQFFFLDRREQRRFADLFQIEVQPGLNGGGSHSETIWEAAEQRNRDRTGIVLTSSVVPLPSSDIGPTWGRLWR